MRTTGYHQMKSNCIVRIPEEKRTENIFKAIMSVQTWGEIWTSRAMGPKGRHIDYFKTAIETHCNYTVKSQTRKNFKRSRGATHHIQGTTPNRLWSDFSTETLQSWTEWGDIFKILQENKTLSSRSALGRPRGMGRGGRWEGGSGWGIHVNPWLIHVNVWQKPLQYCKVINLQLIKINGKKQEYYNQKKQKKEYYTQQNHLSEISER